MSLINSVTSINFDRIKEHESLLNHDVKAIEYFIKEKLDKFELSEYKEFVHCGLTSQDINSVAFTIILNNVINYLKEEFEKFIEHIEKLMGIEERFYKPLEKDLWENIRRNLYTC